MVKHLNYENPPHPNHRRNSYNRTVDIIRSAVQPKEIRTESHDFSRHRQAER